jgi:hypothetical protein
MAFTKTGGYSGPAATKQSGGRVQVGSTLAEATRSVVTTPPKTTGSYRPAKLPVSNGSGESNGKK